MLSLSRSSLLFFNIPSKTLSIFPLATPSYILLLNPPTNPSKHGTPGFRLESLSLLHLNILPSVSESVPQL